MKYGMILSILTLVFACLEPAFAIDSALVQSAASVETARPLPFRTGDALVITTYPDSAGFPSGFYPIDGDGYVDFPIIGYVKVIGMQADTLAKMLSEKYIDFMRYPYMRIRPLIRVAMNGGFYRPGLYWMDPHSTLWEAVQTAGGTQRADGFKKVKWERDNIILNDNLTAMIQEGRSLYQIGMQSGDQISTIHKPQQTRWEVFRNDILPILTLTFSTAVSAFTAYNSYQMYQRYQTR